MLAFRDFIRLILAVVVLILSGCVGRPLKQAYSEYSQVYGEALNKQLLLNLARLSEDEPPYFVQLGQISAQFAYTASVGFGPSSFVNKNNPSGVAAAVAEDTWTAGASASGGIAHTPTFQFVPLNGDQFAQAINAPIPDRLFYTLYDQGFHADRLVRTTVTSIRFLNESDEIERVLVNHPKHETYPEFLKFCSQLTEAQRNRLLIVKQSKPPTTNIFNDIKLADAVAATAAGFSVTANPNVPASSNSFQVVVVQKGFTLQPASTNAAKALERDPNFRLFATHKVDFQLRTFISALYAAAKEENYFGNGASTNIAYFHDQYGKFGIVNLGQSRTNAFTMNLSQSGALTTNLDSEMASTNEMLKVRPILTLTGYEDSARSSLLKIAEIRHNGQTFTVGDVASDQGSDSSNKSVFTLLSYLFAQISIDPQKLPVQQFIQVR
jgi:hypothetical protein